MENFLDNYMKQVVEEGIKNGVEFKETIQNDTSDIELDEHTYANNLKNEGMMSDDMFKMFENKFNIDWNHVKQVSELAEAKELLKQMNKEKESKESADYKERIRQLALKIRMEAEKLK